MWYLLNVMVSHWGTTHTSKASSGVSIVGSVQTQCACGMQHFCCVVSKLPPTCSQNKSNCITLNHFRKAAGSMIELIPAPASL